MNWEELRNRVYYEDGSLRDIYIRNITPADWRCWADYVNANYPVDFFIGSVLIGKSIDFNYVDSYWQDSNLECPAASIHLGHIIVNTFFSDEHEIENDVSPKEITSSEDHQTLVEYLKKISILLNRPVELTEENYKVPEEILMIVEGDKVTFPDK